MQDTYKESEVVTLDHPKIEDITSHVVRPDVNGGAPEFSPIEEDVTTLDLSNYVLTTDGACSRKVKCHCHVNVDTVDSERRSQEVQVQCPCTAAMDGAPLTDGNAVLTDRTRDSVEKHDVSATADELYLVGAAGFMGYGASE